MHSFPCRLSNLLVPMWMLAYLSRMDRAQDISKVSICLLDRFLFLGAIREPNLVFYIKEEDVASSSGVSSPCQREGIETWFTFYSKTAPNKINRLPTYLPTEREGKRQGAQGVHAPSYPTLNRHTCDGRYGFLPLPGSNFLFLPRLTYPDPHIQLYT